MGPPIRSASGDVGSGEPVRSDPDPNAKKSVFGYQATPAMTCDEQPVAPTVPSSRSFIAVEGDEGREVTSRRLTPDADRFTVDADVLTELTQPPDRGLDVMKARWEEGFAAEAVLHQGNSDASLDQRPTDGFGHRAMESRTEQKGAAVDPHHHRHRAAGGTWPQDVHSEGPEAHNPRVLNVGVTGAAGWDVGPGRGYLLRRGIRRRWTWPLLELHARTVSLLVPREDGDQ